jgi:rubrerythrin
MTTHDPEHALAVVQRALHNEIAGQRFYNDAAYYCIDPWAKEIFASLAREEEEHTRLLLVEYEALTTRGRWLDLDTAMSNAADLDITRFTFPELEPAVELFPPEWPASQAVDRRADDLAALAFGMEMEDKAIALYGEEARTNKDRAARQAYEFLIEEERRHYHQLRTQWEKLAGRAFRGT